MRKMAILRVASSPERGYIVIDDNYRLVYAGKGWGMKKDLESAFGPNFRLDLMKADADIFCTHTDFNIDDWISYRKRVDQNWQVQDARRRLMWDDDPE